jgi:hypothetical protein
MKAKPRFLGTLLPRLLGGCLLLGGLVPALAALDQPTRRIEDDSSLRISIRDTWLTEAPGRVLNHRSFIHTLPSGDRIEVRAEQGKEEFGIVLAREQNGSYTGWGQGSWVLVRRRDNGAPSRIRIFPRSDPTAYIQFRPFTEDKSLMDVVIYNAYLVHGLPVAFPFERLLVIPLEDVLAAAGNRFPRRYFEIEPAMYRDSRAFIGEVRKRLPALSFRDDGALNEEGRYVFIETLEAQKGEGGLNCSGFAKWVVDGILRPFTGNRLEISPLKAPFGSRGSSFTEPWEELRDPFFGLDWTRNLASAAFSVLRTPNFGGVEEIEVRRWPFSTLILRDNGSASTRSYPGFLLNAGFGFEGLQPLLYTLAIDEPGRVYLASVNTEMGPPSTPSNPRGMPRLRQHFHVAVLVPYFNERGDFQVAVFESAAETSFSGFRTRYPGHYINLVRIPLEGGFDP